MLSYFIILFNILVIVPPQMHQDGTRILDLRIAIWDLLFGNLNRNSKIVNRNSLPDIIMESF